MMERRSGKQSEEEIAAKSAAIKEEKICANDIIEEIEPLFREYFVGNFTFEDGELGLSFYNGQRFRLGVREA